MIGSLMGRVAFVSTLLAPSAVWASDVGTVLSARQFNDSIDLRVGFDNALVTTGVGYTRGISISRIHRTLMVGGEVSMPMTRPDWGDVSIQADARLNAYAIKGFELPFLVGMTILHTRNDLFRATGVGTTLATYPGYYRSRWFVAAEVRWNQTWAAHLHHTDQYRDEIYPSVQDGWYQRPAWSMRYGLRVGGLPHPRIELMLRGGYQQIPGTNALIPPLYVDLTTGLRF